MFDIISYFKNIATSHKKILHTEQKPAFFREFSSRKVILDNSDLLMNMRNSSDVVLNITTGAICCVMTITVYLGFLHQS